MRSVTHSPQPKPTPEYLLNTPLPQLLAEFRVRVTVLESEDFAGWSWVDESGGLLLVRPAGQPEAVWESIARSRLARSLGVSLPRPPEADATVGV